jgi:hypothetical protein
LQNIFPERAIHNIWLVKKHQNKGKMFDVGWILGLASDDGEGIGGVRFFGK